MEECDMGNLKKIEEIKNFTKKIRLNILDTALAAGSNSSHFGGSLSTVEIIATLYSIMKFRKINDIDYKFRDRFILSKGHGCLAYYSALAQSGFFSISDLSTFENNNSFLLGHPVINRNKGIEFSNGSLGMGLSLGIGVSIALKKNKIENKIYVLMGDGECNEGSVWEAIIAAPNFKLNNLTAIIDRNNFQQTGSGEEIMNLGDLKEKVRNFGWDTFDLDGHNIKDLLDCFLLKNHSEKPKMIIANTIKGKGFSFSESNNDWHHSILTKKQYDFAKDELDN